MNHFRNLFIASLLSSGAYAQNSSSQAEQDLANSLKSQQSIRNNVQSETANPWSRTFPDPWGSQFWGGTTGKQTLAGGVDLVAARWLYKAASRIDLLAGEKVKDITQVADVKKNSKNSKYSLYKLNLKMFSSP